MASNARWCWLNPKEIPGELLLLLLVIALGAREILK